MPSSRLTGLVLGQDGMQQFKHLVHLFRGLSDGQATDGVAFPVERQGVFGRPQAQVGIDAALDDGEEGLAVAVKGFGLVEVPDTSFEPALGEAQRLFGIAVVRIAGTALVQRHHDVGPDDALGIDIVFGREDVPRPVDVRLEDTTFFREFPALGE